MCTNGAKNAAALLKAIRPSLIVLLAFIGQTNTTAGIAVVTAFDAAVTALANWQQGTLAQNVLQLINDFVTGLNALATSLNLPTNVIAMVDVILAGIETVIGIITANSPAPAGTLAELHQAAVAHDTVVAVHARIPGIKLSRFESAQTQYDNAWERMRVAGGLPDSLKIS